MGAYVHVHGYAVIVERQCAALPKLKQKHTIKLRYVTLKVRRKKLRNETVIS